MCNGGWAPCPPPPFCPPPSASPASRLSMSKALSSSCLQGLRALVHPPSASQRDLLQPQPQQQQQQYGVQQQRLLGLGDHGPHGRNDSIVSLCPGATGTLLAMGLDSRVVGVSDACAGPWPQRAVVARHLAGGACAGVGELGGPPSACTGSLAAPGVGPLWVDEDALRAECPALVILPDMTRTDP